MWWQRQKRPNYKADRDCALVRLRMRDRLSVMKGEEGHKNYEVWLLDAAHTGKSSWAVGMAVRWWELCALLLGSSWRRANKNKALICSRSKSPLPERKSSVRKAQTTSAMTVRTIASLRDSIPVAKQFLVLASEHEMPVGARQKKGRMSQARQGKENFLPKSFAF